MLRFIRVLVVAAAVLANAWVSLATTDPSPIVAGVTQIVSPGAPGPVLPLSADWAPVAGGDDDTSVPSLFAIARDYALGRVVMLGHDGLPGNVGTLDNARFMRNTIHWLDVAAQKRVGYTTGHGEWLGAGSLAGLGSDLAAAGYTVVPLPAPLTADALAGVSVLIIGNAWGTVTDNEIEVVRQWVAGGNGLFMAGLGWSWPGDFETYPMLRLATPYEARWVRHGSLSDPTNHLGGSPIFHTFYPNIPVAGPLNAMAVIDAAHAAHGSGWAAALEADATLRHAVALAHALLGAAEVELPAGHVLRQQMFDYLDDLVAREPAAYARLGPLNAAMEPTATWLRERFLRTWYDCLSPTPALRARIATAVGMAGSRRDLFLDFGILLLDNDGLNAQQLAFIHRYFTLLPSGLHVLRAISVADFLGRPPLAIPLNGVGQQMNIFGFTYHENSFPNDVPPGIVDGFAVVLAHEANHQVNAFTIGGTPRLAAHQAQLIADAGTDRMNYLRSMLSDGFFVGAPQEFFASISNQWFTDSSKTVDLGIVRFDAGRPDPINQALFFAEVYSQGGDTTSFYLTDTVPTISRRPVAIHRNAGGFIDEIEGSQHRYRFTLDAAGRATSYTIVADNRVPTADAGQDQVLECRGHTGTEVTLNASASSDPDGNPLTFEWKNAAGEVFGMSAVVNLPLLLGSHTFVVTVQDGQGGTASDAVTIALRDTKPPALVSSVSRTILWPPNRRLVDVELSLFTTDACHLNPARSVSVTADETSHHDAGNGAMSPAAQLIRDSAGNFVGLRLRAERNGNGDGRVYLIRMTATDGSGNASTTCRAVTVPHDQSPGSMSSLAAQAAAAVTACVPLEHHLVGLESR